MPGKTTKPKIAIYSLTSCEGCQFALFDLGEKFLDFLKRVELAQFRLFKEEDKKYKIYDIVFVEGSPITKENLGLLKRLRECSRVLVVLGNCAAHGGVPELKAYQKGRGKALCYVYKNPETIDNLEIQEVGKIVKADFTIPGCPITGEEFLNFAQDLISGKIPNTPQRPVCFECQHSGYKCLLQAGKMCFGPITIGGCKAVCLKSQMPCWGCRGLLEQANIKNFLKLIDKQFSLKEFERTMEIFGIRDSFCEKYKS